MSTENVDLLIVGTGAVGATFARRVSAAVPDARILMVDTGRQLSEMPGTNLKNLPVNAADHVVSASEPSHSAGGGPAVRAQQIARGTSGLARRGTALLEPASTGLPGGAMSTNVGGMAAHWTCASPRSVGSERMGFVPPFQWDQLFTEAEKLLRVTTRAFPPSRRNAQILARLGSVFDAGAPPTRQVQPMPLACEVDSDGSIRWTGVDTILGQLQTENSSCRGFFELAPETICRQVLLRRGRAVGAVLEHIPTGSIREVHARAVVVAADAFRTPQLLWASGVRPAALGRYFNDHPQVLSAVRLADTADDPDSAEPTPGEEKPTAASGVFWVPYSEGSHPFHGQVMHFDMSSVQITSLDPEPSRHVVALSWYCPKDIRREDRVSLSDTEVDRWGMPQIHVEQTLTPVDHDRVGTAIEHQKRAAAALGEFVEGQEPDLLPGGSSLHYQGSVRMGAVDDGTSVCSPDSQVWQVENLFVGGNGVIASPIACNPTLTSVALAIRSSEHIARTLST